MEIIELEISGVFLIKSNVFKDNRGSFIKVFNKDFFKEKELDYNFKESYYSVSNKNVIRGMHFQIPNKDHTKLVYVNSGSIKDVLLDIRKSSITYGKSISIELEENDGNILYIPKGIAHGFLSKQNNTLVTYMQTTCYSKEHDFGIKFDSFGFDWGIKKPIISERDLDFIDLKDFKSPFN